MSAHRFEGFTPISSGHLDGAKYNSTDRVMTVRFRNGWHYNVHGVPPEAYQEFLDAPSHGSHWHNHITQNYHVERVR